MNPNKAFRHFLESLKGKGQDALIETVVQGFKTLHEVQDYDQWRTGNYGDPEAPEKPVGKGDEDQEPPDEPTPADMEKDEKERRSLEKASSKRYWDRTSEKPFPEPIHKLFVETYYEDINNYYYLVLKSPYGTTGSANYNETKKDEQFDEKLKSGKYYVAYKIIQDKREMGKSYAQAIWHAVRKLISKENADNNVTEEFKDRQNEDSKIRPCKWKDLAPVIQIAAHSLLKKEIGYTHPDFPAYLYHKHY